MDPTPVSSKASCKGGLNGRGPESTHVVPHFVSNTVGCHCCARTKRGARLRRALHVWFWHALVLVVCQGARLGGSIVGRAAQLWRRRRKRCSMCCFRAATCLSVCHVGLGDVRVHLSYAFVPHRVCSSTTRDRSDLRSRPSASGCRKHWKPSLDSTTCEPLCRSLVREMHALFIR